MIKTKKRGSLIIISGTTCAGKGTIVKELLKHNENMVCSISCTSREKRVGEVDGKDYYFLNNVGFGLDGYCSGEAERMLSEGATEINFAKIAIGGLFGRFKPSCATIFVSGNTRTFKRVYIATTMHGRYYGGGMLPTPNQDRLNRNHNVSTILMYGCGPLSVLFTFPAFFKGTHLKKARICKVYSGYDVNVIFD